MESIAQCPSSFGERNFGRVDLGDVRRNRRLVQLANQMVQHPSGSLPHKLRRPADLFALYRLCRCTKVTHEAVLAPHRQAVMEQIQQLSEDVLVIHDSTEFDYSQQKSLTELGQIGDGHGRGYIVQNSLAVRAKSGQVIGLANQILHTRARVPKSETRQGRRERKSRESMLWVHGTQGLPADRKLIDVVDRGGDTYEFIEHELQSGRRFVIRSQHNRNCVAGQGVATRAGRGWLHQKSLHTFVRTLSPQGTFELQVKKSVPTGKLSRSRNRNGTLKHPPRSGRLAQMCFTSTAVQLLPPHAKSGRHGRTPLPVWVVRVWEQNPPAGEKALEWILLTNEPVLTEQDALRIIHWYQQRWIIEEYHKAQKTGCQIESMHFQYESRLEPMLALLSVVALTLLQLRDAARTEDAKQRPARELIGQEYVAALSLWRHHEVRPDWTVHEFILALGRLGGHLNRKGDGLPGWITLWRGWAELQPRVETAALLKKIKKRCV